MAKTIIELKKIKAIVQKGCTQDKDFNFAYQSYPEAQYRKFKAALRFEAKYIEQHGFQAWDRI